MLIFPVLTKFKPHNLKKLAEYDQSTSTDHRILLNDNEDHPVQNRECPENSFEEIVVSNPDQEKKPEATMDTELSSTKYIHPLAVQESPHDSDICQLIREECSIEFLCIRDDIDNLIESVLDSKLLSINSQRLDKKEQEVKNVVEQPTERRNRAEKSWQNFKVVHKSSISLKNTSQISLIHSIAHIESTKEPEHFLSMGYEHLSITPKTESNVENLLPIPCKWEDNDDLDSSNDESLPDKDVLAKEFKVYLNSLFDNEEINSDKLDPHCFNVESDFGESFLNRDTFIDFSSKFDFSGELTHIQPEIPKSDFDFEEEIRLIENLLYDNSFPRPSEELNAEIADTIIESIPLLPIPVQDDNSQQEEIDIVIKIDDVMPLKGDIHFLEELLIDNSILSHESSDSNFEDNPSISRPPPEPPDDNFDLEAEVIQAVMEDIDEPDEHFNLGGENFVFTNIEDIDYFPFMIVIRIFLPYLILPEISPLLLSAESEDMIFDPGIFD
nr:hypothetical protein [Tanacetum cinerariifolium]